MEIILSLLCVLVHIPTLMLRYVPFKERVSSKNKKRLIFWYTAGLIPDFFLCLWIIETGRMTVTFYKFNMLFYCVIMGIVNILIIKGYTKEHLFFFWSYCADRLADVCNRSIYHRADRIRNVE